MANDRRTFKPFSDPQRGAVDNIIELADKQAAHVAATTEIRQLCEQLPNTQLAWSILRILQKHGIA